MSELPQVDPRAVTSRGYPYPLRSWPADVAVDIQNLAEAVNDDVAGVVAVVSAPCTLATGWVNLGGEHGNLTVERVGKQVILRGVVKPTATTAIPGIGGIPFATVPAGFRPQASIVVPATTAAAGTGSAYARTDRVDITAAGSMQIRANSSLSMTTSGFISLGGISWTTA